MRVGPAPKVKVSFLGGTQKKSSVSRKRRLDARFVLGNRDPKGPWKQMTAEPQGAGRAPKQCQSRAGKNGVREAKQPLLAPAGRLTMRDAPQSCNTTLLRSVQIGHQHPKGNLGSAIGDRIRSDCVSCTWETARRGGTRWQPNRGHSRELI
jgi:hypothetical protein